MTKSEEILERQKAYNKVERVVDDYDRSIGVKRLRPSQQLLIQEMAPGLEGNTPVQDDETGETFQMPRISPLILAASVCEMDGATITFPRNRAELNSILDALDGVGLRAVAEGLAKLTAEAAGPQGAGVEAAKN